jgi:colanic acid/amylovoran biosynthesis protein
LRASGFLTIPFPAGENSNAGEMEEDRQVKFVVQGDLGQGAYHVGDEAMTVAAVDELSGRTGASFVLLSRDPEQTVGLYGTASIPTIEFPWPPAERSAYLELVRRAVRGDRSALPPADAVWGVMDEVATADGVLIAGGGNMNSLYGWLLYERAAVAIIARELGKPLVVSGQTFGPTLLPQDRKALHELLECAELIGAREPSSYALGFELGIGSDKLVRVLDDGSFLPSSTKGLPSSTEEVPPAGDSSVPALPELPQDGYIAATVGPDAWREGTRTLAAIAGVLDRAALLTGLPVYLLPHMGALGSTENGGDHDSHRTVLAHSRSGQLKMLPVLPVRTAAEVTAAASLVITNRYHPAVFGLAAGVPVVSLANDAYSDIRLSGAHGNWGLGDWTLPLPSLAPGGVDDAVAEAWARRDEIRQHLERLRPGFQQSQGQWWDAVAAVLAGGDTRPGYTGLAEAPALRSAAPWSGQAARQRELFRTLSLGTGRLWTEWDDVRSQRDLLIHERDEAIREKDRILESRTFKAAKLLGRGAGLARRLTGKKR